MALKALPADDSTLPDQLQAVFDEFINKDSDRLINLPAHVSERLEEYVFVHYSLSGELSDVTIQDF